jgi:hypothetical protein
MRYFLFKVKMGHVRRERYLPMTLAIRAVDVEQAVNAAKNHGGVKRDHKDWCLEPPIEVSQEEYKIEKTNLYDDPYWEGNTKARLAMFADRLQKEPNYHARKGIRTNTHEYFKKKDVGARVFKVRRMKEMIDSLDREIDSMILDS